MSLHFNLWRILLPVFALVYTSSIVWQYSKHCDDENFFFLRFAAKKFVRFIIDWLPFAVILTIYENLTECVAAFRGTTIDSILYQLDVMLFGVEPSVWIQKFTHPILTDYLALAYSLYLVMPLSLGCIFYIMDKRREFYTLSTAVITCFCIGFFLYLLLPAGAPRFYLADSYNSPQLTGFFGYYEMMQQAFDKLNPLTYRASFPSLHVALSTLAFFYSVRLRASIPFGRVLQFVYATFAISLWVASIYLRHHWVIDIFAGWIVAVISIFFAFLVRPLEEQDSFD